MRHGANDAELIGDAGGPRQMLAHAQLGIFARNRLERATDFRRGVRLHVEGFELARATEQEEEDDRLRPGLAAASELFGGEEARQRQAKESRTRGFKHGPSCDSIAGLDLRRAEEGKHGRLVDQGGGRTITLKVSAAADGCKRILRVNGEPYVAKAGRFDG